MDTHVPEASISKEGVAIMVGGNMKEVMFVTAAMGQFTYQLLTDTVKREFPDVSPSDLILNLETRINGYPALTVSVADPKT